jgi:hypothetical protein
MKSKEYIDLNEAMGYLLDEVQRIDELIGSLDESKTEEYVELKKKIEGLYADAEEIKKEIESLD